MPPEPALSLTIPSLHDGTPLDCRVYHPASLAAGNPRAAPWKRHAALLAHPYAPLGGSYDDGMVETLAGRLLREGYLVTTFNFRGAGNSAGRTSWTAKPERDDYASVVGFLVHYVHYLDPFRSSHHAGITSREGDDDDKPRITVVGEADEVRQHGHGGTSSARAPPVLLMGGYSYGAMITTQLLPLSALMAPFKRPHAESPAAHIRLRAEHLAGQQNDILGGVRAAARAAALARLRHQQQQQLSPTSPSRRRGGVRIGGDEGPGSPRRSHDSSGGGRRSFSLDDAEERLKRGVGELLAKTRRHGHKGARPGSAGETPRDKHTNLKAEAADPEPQAEATLPLVEGLVVPRASYVLVSPLQGLVTHLATMNLLPSSLTTRHHHGHWGHGRGAAGEGNDDGPAAAAPGQGRDLAEGKLMACPTLAVYGDKDVFVPVSRLRSWVARLTGGDGRKGDEGGGSASSLFRAHEVRDAGHFWAEEGALPEMEEVVGEFAGRLLRGLAEGEEGA
ncbi:hypothetical protein JDV02_010584 [Purpureocillium takamizusanense]|uniref:Uncharacterized protein n=1 Tax=Purpureocillium takamizusanense TaxID=2060973 RepID=A0A9Q8QS34_9HYPO|nr:uncharacterized protein JDV02_010584 [Purpureocillium takamizusanense]UNI24865.1 hypothetical protein JDV02_010584 [Purpureocillium takamizusanense]